MRYKATGKGREYLIKGMASSLHPEIAPRVRMSYEDAKVLQSTFQHDPVSLMEVVWSTDLDDEDVKRSLRGLFEAGYIRQIDDDEDGNEAF